MALAISLGGAAPAAGQNVTQPRQPWRTIQTEHFNFHAPAALEEWTQHVAARMESYATAVSALVGNRPASRVTVVVEDPTGDANGYAIPLLDRPVIVLWPTPPTPSLSFGDHRGWGEILALHEYAHIAHLTYPSRNPRERFWWSLLPARVGPVARNSPPWVFEGYATLIEGRLTGSGRPHSAGRAAILREWALHGKLPSYAALNSTQAFMGGAMRYLVGSAFLEWLAERKGPESLQQLWRRMSARTSRTFAAAFTGVYGVPAADLYGEFVVDLTDRALRVRHHVRAASVIEGELFQRLNWGTGEPAISPDGARLAVALRQPNVPPRLVVWRTGPEGVDSVFLRARARVLARDSLDVAPFDSFPLPRRVDRTLRAPVGGGYNNPRWFTDGARILVSRDMPLGNGASRPDLFIWTWRSGDVRRVTRGAGIRFADPSPDGSQAVGVRCDAGRCGLVLVSLQDGTWRQLVAGAFDVTWHRPRWSADGRRIAASVQRDGRWQIAVVDAATGQVTYVAPNETASRHSPVWLGADLVVVSERTGIPNLEILSVESGTVRPLTNVVGAVTAPDARSGDNSIWYLDLHPNGLDLRRVDASAIPANTIGPLPADLRPTSPILREIVAPFDSIGVTSRGYGLGPRAGRYLPGFGAGADGAYALLAITNYDPAGRLGVLAQGAYGQRRVWRGGSLGVAWRGSPWFDVKAEAFASQPGAPRNVDNPRFDGAALSLNRTRDFGSLAWSWQLGATTNNVRADDTTRFDRQQAHAALALATRRNRGLLRQVQLQLYGGLGETDATDVRRGVASLGVVAGAGAARLRLSVAAGRVSFEPDTAQMTAAFEAFTLGGLEVPLFDQSILPQRISTPALPAGSASGRAFQSYRAALSQSALPVSLYAEWYKLYDPNGGWRRLLGVEGQQGFPTVGFASLPNVNLSYGAAYSIDYPRRHRWTLYAGARFAP